MPKGLFSLFDDRLKSPDNLVTTPSQNLDGISTKTEEQEQILRKIKKFETVKHKVDYSDFSNFVFFNSAEDYFNISGEKIINEYPFDGTVEQIEAFGDDLDAYQNHLVSEWPKSLGYLKFDPSVGNAYVKINDYGVEQGIARSSLLNPGTGSLSVEFWCVPPPALTGSQDAMFLLQKRNDAGEGYSAYFSGSRIHFEICSSSFVDRVSCDTIPGRSSFFCCVLDRDSTKVTIASGSRNEFPVVVSSASFRGQSGILSFNSSSLYIASGSLTGKNTVKLTGSVDDVRLWNTARTLVDLTSSFNSRLYAQSGLIGYWRFSETGSVGNSFANPENSVVFDSSGHRINGAIQNYYTGLRQSGSLVPFDYPDMILQIDSKEIRNMISEKQLSGSSYDRDNDNLITRLFPDQFFILEQDDGTNVLRNFLYLIARQFDEIKVGIDQFVNVTKANYGNFDQVPDALLADAGKFFGWEFTGNFLDKNAFQYILGRDVLSDLERNRELDKKLFEIKNEFWRRVLVNLMHLYKTKGTKESVESLLRIYGVNKNFVRLKEYGSKPNVGISTFRISSEKSVPALCFGTGSASGSVVTSPSLYTNVMAVESRIRFPTTASSDLQPSFLTGSIWTVSSGTQQLYHLSYERQSFSSNTGSLTLHTSDGIVMSVTQLPIFDNRWLNITMDRESVTGSMTISVRAIDEGQVDEITTFSLMTPQSSSLKNVVLTVGSSGTEKSEFWGQEIRVWNSPLSRNELDDHTLNFQSFGTERANGLTDLRLHWRLAENIQTSSSGTIGTFYDISGQNNHGVGAGFASSMNPYKRFLNEYSFIASPEYGWNEEKIRTIDAAEVPIGDGFLDDPRVALEFNMIDALNEDISQIISTMDGFDNSLGSPANRFRESYPDLDVLRENYFKRLQGRLNFRLFFDMLEFFDRSFIDLVKRLIPVRAVFIGDEFIVESHMIERPKLQWNKRRQERNFQPEGRIRILIRD
jgi:hypothetical protein